LPDDKIGKRFYCRMKFLFIVQGEGRGHLTQAISLKEILVKNGHEVVGVMVGKSNRRELPDFFRQGIQTDIYRFNRKATGANFLIFLYKVFKQIFIASIVLIFFLPKRKRPVSG